MLDLSALEAKARSEAPPPRWFKPLAGQPRDVKLTSIEQWTSLGLQRKKRSTQAQKTGIRFEKQAREMLELNLPSARFSLKLAYTDLTGRRYCELDGLYQRDDRAVIFEIKVNHSAAAWWQLRQFYGPIVEEWLGLPVVLVEVVRSYDPAVAFPEEHEVHFSVLDLLEKVRAPLLPSKMQVLEWKPQSS